MNANTTSGRSPADVPEHPELYWPILFGGMAIIAIMLIIALTTWSSLLFDGLGITFNSGPTAIVFVIIYLVLSFKEVRADEVAGAYHYGKALVRLNSGPHFAPFGLMQILKAPRTVQEFQCPGEPETIQKGDDKVPLEPGMVRPIRAVTRAPKASEKDLLDTQMTLEVSFVVQYAITDILDYKANFGSKEEIEKQLRDIGEVTIVEDITQNTPASFINTLPDINEKLAGQVKKRFKNSGIKVVSVRLISPDITHDVSKALANIPIARAEAKQVEIKAGGEQVRLTREGDGKASAELAMLNARAEGQKRMMKQLKVGGEVIIAAEAVRGLSDKTDVLVVGAEGGMRDVMGLVKGAQSTLNSKTLKGAMP